MLCVFQASSTIMIIKAHHRFILGQKGKKLAQLELETATKINIPRTEENSDEIKIFGSKEGIEKARHEIQLISDEQAKLAFERMPIPKVGVMYIIYYWQTIYIASKVVIMCHILVEIISSPGNLIKYLI